MCKGSPHEKKNVFFWALPELVPLSLDVKNDVLARITEPSNDDYDNGVSDNCDQNFGTLMILVLKMTKKYTHNTILMSRYKGQLHGEKR